MKNHSTYAILGLACLAVGLGGCQKAPLAKGNTWLSYPDAPERVRSIVFDSPVVNEVLADRGGHPWYASRNDAVRSVFAGYRSRTVDRIVTITSDRQITSGGKARDYYTSTSYRQSVTTIVR